MPSAADGRGAATSSDPSELLLEPLEDEYDVGISPPPDAASASALEAASTCALCASQRACASAYCYSHFSRCDSKPGSHSFVSGSKPSGYL